jgi:glucokinase
MSDPKKLEDVKESLRWLLQYTVLAVEDLKSLEQSANTAIEKINEHKLEDEALRAAIENIKKLTSQDWHFQIKEIKETGSIILQRLHDAEVPGYGSHLSEPS